MFGQVKRALNYSTTGVLAVPRERLGEYSRANWGDKTELREGREVPVKTTTGLIIIVRKLQTKTWKKIVAAAIEASIPQKRANTTREIIDVDAEAGAEEVILVDNDSDW